MKIKRCFGFLVLCLPLLTALRQPDEREPVVAPATILNDMMSFLTYRAHHVRLYEDFKALDASAKPISRAHFLQQLTTGAYVPLRLKSGSPVYRLHQLGESVNSDVKNTIKYWGLEEYDRYRAEGKPLPPYRFVDRQGRVYTPQSTRGKVLVIKCWFIACLPCVKEMPALNELKQQYQNRADILFVSLCLDSPKAVETFLRKTRFDYAVVPDQNDYLTNKMQINAYPTHLVINRQGLIVKKTDSYEGMAYALKKEAAR